MAEIQKDLLSPEEGWRVSDSIRLATPPRSEWGFLLRSFSFVARFFKRPELPNIFPVFNLNPSLFWPWLFFASRLMPFGRLPGRLREKIILRVAWNSRCRYEWVQHLELAAKIGVSDEDIIAVTKGENAMQKEADRFAIMACDQLCNDKVISELCWQALEKHFNQKQIIELTILVGHYEMLAGFLINSGVQTEDFVEHHLKQFHQRIASKGLI